MPYLLHEYLRHLDEWTTARSLTRVRPRPEEGEVWIEVGSATDEVAVNLRIMHMLSELGCTPEQRRYYGPRFFWVNRFVGMNIARLTKEWLVIVDDGEKAVITRACYKAVLEEFEPDPMPNISELTLENIVARGRELLKTGFSEPA